MTPFNDEQRLWYRQGQIAGFIFGLNLGFGVAILCLVLT
jgi:hypothetical protein